MRSLSRRLPVRGRGYDLSYRSCGPLRCNVFSFVCGKTSDAVVIDPSTHDPGEFDAMVDHLEGAKVRKILLTHGHADHIAGIADVAKVWPNASIHLHRLEEENYDIAREQGQYFGISVPPNLPQPTDTLEDGQVINIGETIKLKVLHTPGHAPGHVAFVDEGQVTTTATLKTEVTRIITNNRIEKASSLSSSLLTAPVVIIGGDLLFRGSVGRTDFFNSSVEDLLVSIRRLYEEYHEDSIVLSGHTTATYLRTERKSQNNFVSTALQRSVEWYEEAKERHGWK